MHLQHQYTTQIRAYKEYIGIEQRIKAIENKLSSAKEPCIRKSAESKAAQHIRELVSDKAGIRVWGSQFINAMTQIHPWVRYLFEVTTTKLDQHRIALSETDITDIMRATRYASNQITIPPSEVGKEVYDMLFSEKIEEYLSLGRNEL